MAILTADVAIIGGGAAGCLTAAAVRTADPSLKVVVVDPTDGDRHRIGEALLTGTIMTLKDAGLIEAVHNEGFHRKDGAAYAWGESRTPWYVNYPDGVDDYPEEFTSTNGRHAIHVPRHAFDAMLHREMSKRGVEFVKQKASDIAILAPDNETEKSPTIRYVELEDGTKVYAREYVDCTGQASFIGRRLSRRTPVAGARIARYAYTRAIDWEKATHNGFCPHRTNIISSENGWFWAIHLGERGDGLTSFGFVSTPDILSKVTLGNCCQAFPETELFGFQSEKGFREPKQYDGRDATSFYGHPDYSYACETLDGPNWSLAGDAAMFIDPILSQGVTLASHYGFLRGKASVARLDGDEDAHKEVTLHYRREGAVMRDVVGMWYENNRSVEKWRLKTVAKAAEYGADLTPVDAFRWITNLENIRNEYDPYPPSERRVIRRELGAGTCSVAP